MSKALTLPSYLNHRCYVVFVVGDDTKAVDSDEEDLEPEEDSSGTRRKCRKQLGTAGARASALAQHHGDPLAANPPGFGSAWLWMPGPWMQQQHLPQPQWVMPPQSGPVPYSNPWGASAQLGDGSTASPGNVDSASRASHRRKRSQLEQDRGSKGKKPHQIRVKAGGEIYAGYEGKNAWDDSVRGYVSKMLDISIIHWDEHNPKTLKKLRETLDAEFDYLDHPLSLQGFRNTIKRFLKIERFRLKTRFLAGNENCPAHV
jgi:hypothetical protein